MATVVEVIHEIAGASAYIGNQAELEVQSSHEAGRMQHMRSSASMR